MPALVLQGSPCPVISLLQNIHHIILSLLYQWYIIKKEYPILENMSQKSIVSLLTVEQPYIVIDLLINKIYF